jgi:hypothetical protein
MILSTTTGRRIMKRFFATLLFVTGYAFTAFGQGCMTLPEHQAFNTIALKSYLMVAALSCDATAEYNQFMIVFQPYISTEQHVLDGYFQRAAGRQGQTQEDGYETLLANSQSEASQRAGSGYCGQVEYLYGAVLNLSSASDLAGFVSNNPPPQPVSMNACLPGTLSPAARPAPVMTAANAAPRGPLFAGEPAAATPAVAAPAVSGDPGPVSPATAATVASLAAKSLVRAQPLPGSTPMAEHQPRSRLAIAAKARHTVPARQKPKLSPYMQTQVV